MRIEFRSVARSGDVETERTASAEGLVGESVERAGELLAEIIVKVTGNPPDSERKRWIEAGARANRELHNEISILKNQLATLEGFHMNQGRELEELKKDNEALKAIAKYYHEREKAGAVSVGIIKGEGETCQG